MKCDRCESNYADEYFKDKYTDEIVCLDCILSDCIESTTTHYTTIDGNYLGSDDDMEEVANSIESYTSFKRIEED